MYHKYTHTHTHIHTHTQTHTNIHTYQIYMYTYSAALSRHSIKCIQGGVASYDASSLERSFSAKEPYN